MWTSEKYASRGQVIGSTSDIYGKTEAFFPVRRKASKQPANKQREGGRCGMPISPQSNGAKYRALGGGDHACFFVASSRLLFFSEGSKDITIVDKSRIKMPHHPAGAMERDEANHMIGSGYSSHLLYLANSGGSGQRDRECPSSKWRRGLPPSLPPSGPSRAPGGDGVTS